jgi:23S rRNA pseudouridine2605 synthase
MTEERLQKILAQAGLGSRRSCETLIESGRVTVNGVKATLGQKADASIDKISVDGKTIPQAKGFRYICLYKPRFVLCDKNDPVGRKSVFDLVEGGNELSVIGRLDYESEGMVILTNDGALVNQLTHPRYQHEKEYRVLLSTHPDDEQLEIWRRGVVLEDGHRTAPAKVTLESKSGKGAWVRVVLKEGHKRQVREMARVTGLFIVKLMRVRIGSLTINNLKPGEFRILGENDIEKLKANPGSSASKRTVKKTRNN